MTNEPETPAPLFAIRAFKSVIFGTPGMEDSEEDHTMRIKDQKGEGVSSSSDSSKYHAWNLRSAVDTKRHDLDTVLNVNASPTKSILLTPGTASNRRKTVSFGDSVVDNERKRDISPTKTSEVPRTSPSIPRSKWLSSSSEDGKKPRSKLTQTLLDARDKSTSLSAPVSYLPEAARDSLRGAVPETVTTTAEDGNNDTDNLNYPRSESGKYWKAEYESYKEKTSNEIKKLIQYRSAAKSFAKKKTEEASRLANKLKDEENKVAEMEHRVTQLASTATGDGTKAEREQLVQDLTKQTALMLQYKHRVSLLRKLLERNGVVESELDSTGEYCDVGGRSEEIAGDNSRVQANAKSDDLRTELNKLRGLVRSSEEKASKLEMENATLKQSLARAKQETSKHESRRLEKEGRMRQREAKLEGRIKDYRERLKKSSQERRSKEQEHHGKEQALQAAFDEERSRMMEEIRQLRRKLYNTNRVTSHSINQDNQVPDLPYYSLSEIGSDESDIPPSPSPRPKSQAVYDLQDATIDQEENYELNNADEDTRIEQSLPRDPYSGRRVLHKSVTNSDAQYRLRHPSRTYAEHGTALEKQKYATHGHRYQQKRAQASVTVPRHLFASDQRPRVISSGKLHDPVKHNLAAMNGPSYSYATELSAREMDDLAFYRETARNVERMIAATVRLKEKERARKARESEKENTAPRK